MRSFEYTDENWQPVYEQVKTVFLLLLPLTNLTTVCSTSPFLELLTVVTYLFVEAELEDCLTEGLVGLLVNEEMLLTIAFVLSVLQNAAFCFLHFTDISDDPFCKWMVMTHEKFTVDVRLKII